MTNEEKYIRSKMGSGNPFRMPEGYLDSLVDNVMAQLPEIPVVPMTTVKKPLLYRMRPLLYAAACLLVAVLSVTAYLQKEENNLDAEQQIAVQSSTDTYLDDVADYTMIDNYEIYACLTNEY